MWSLLGNMFGSSKAGEKLLDSAVNGVDKLFYTSEEKSEDKARARTEAYAVYMKWLEGTTGSRVARRLLALGAFIIWALEHIIGSVFSVVAIWADRVAPGPGMVSDFEKFSQAAELLRDQAMSNNALVGVVFAFYFGGPVAVDVSKNMLTKWTGSDNARRNESS